MPHADWSLGDQDWFSLLSWEVISKNYFYYNIRLWEVFMI